MIEKVTVVNANYSGLEAYFPKDHELNTDSNLVLVVGPNGSGKTAFLRMLATSLDYERYFREHKISKLWTESYSESGEHTSMEKYIPLVNEVKKVEPGWYYAQLLDDFIELLARHSISDSRFNFDVKRDLKYFETYGPDHKRQYDVSPYEAFHAVSEEALQRLKDLEGILREESDLNVWRYLKPEIKGEAIYFQETTPLVVKEALPEYKERRRYISFDPIYDGRVTHHLFSEKFKSAGQALKMDADKMFEDITNFFEKKLNPVWTKPNYSLEARVGRVFGGIKPQTHENVQEGSQLVVFMDEPSPFFDYRNKYEFRDKVLTTLEKHSPRLQIFIATNDPILIEKTPGCKFINLYQQPAVATSTRSIPLQ